jgi:hypothetical protein
MTSRLRACQSEITDMENWDANCFALFGKAKGIRFTLPPGETLSMPSGWRHTARFMSPSTTISINVSMPRIGPTSARVSAVTRLRGASWFDNTYLFRQVEITP